MQNAKIHIIFILTKFFFRRRRVRPVFGGGKMEERVLSGRGIGRRKQCFVEFGKEFGRYGVAVGVGEGLGEMGKGLIV